MTSGATSQCVAMRARTGRNYADAFVITVHLPPRPRHDFAPGLGSYGSRRAPIAAELGVRL